MNQDELKFRFRNASHSFIDANSTTTITQHRGSGKVDKLERSVGHGTMGAVQVQAGIRRRFLVHVKSYRRRLLDQDNLCCKYLVDLCRYAGVLPSDAPGTAEIKVSQEKVGSKEREFVRIEIYEL